MTRRRSRRPRKPKTIVEEAVPEEEVALDEEEVEEFNDEEEEEVEVVKTPRRRRRKKAAPPSEPEDVEEEEAPPTRRRRKRTTVKDAVPDVTPEAKIGQATAGELMEAILQVVEAGHSISIVKIAGKYVLHRAGSTGAVRSIKGTKAMTRKDFEDIAYSDEFKEFHPEWAKFTYEEKVDIANDEDVSWDHHENPKVDVMRLTAAVRISRDVEKWRPEYRTRDARKDLRDHGILADALNGDEFADEE